MTNEKGESLVNWVELARKGDKSTLFGTPSPSISRSATSGIPSLSVSTLQLPFGHFCPSGIESSSELALVGSVYHVLPPDEKPLTSTLSGNPSPSVSAKPAFVPSKLS